MSARKVEILPKIKMVTSIREDEFTSNELGMEQAVSQNSPVVKNGLKQILDQVLQFVSVGGDFV